jgi:MFS family permease
MKAGTWGAILLVFFFGALAPATIGQIVPTIADFAKEMGLTRPQAGLIVSLPSAVPAVLGLLGGWMVDRWNEKAVLLWSSVALLIGNLIAVFATDVPLMCLARLIEGVSYLGLTVAGASLMIRTTSGPRQTSAMALWGTFVPIGFGGAIFLVAIFHSQGWHIGFMGLAVLAVLAILAVPLLPTPAPSARPPGRTRGLVDVLRKGAAFRLGGAFGANALLQTGIATAIPQYLAAELHVSHGVGGMVTSGQMATNAIAALSVGYLLNRGVSARVIAIAGAVIGFIAAVLIFVPGFSFWAITSAALIFTIGTGLITGLASALIPRAAPNPQSMGATSGLVFQLVLIGVLLGPPIIFSVLGSDAFLNLTLVIIVTSVLSLVLLPVWSGKETLARGAAAGGH